MSIINKLICENDWLEFLNYKINQSNLSKIEQTELENFVNNKTYLPVAEKIVEGKYSFSVPKKNLINKSGSTKKRAVYTFNETENYILKFIAYNLYKYDYIFAPNTYAFRKGRTIKTAFLGLAKLKNINNLYSYKVDISNYFNSININRLLTKLKTVFYDDEKLFNFFNCFLNIDKAECDGKIISDLNHGVMAGTATSTVLANIYLADLDDYFYNNNIIYARYSDDIIVFSESLEELEKHKNYILNHLNLVGLTVNSEKECLTKPNEKWSFLGFEFFNGNIDLSGVTLKKIKDKIKRKAHSLYRWKIKNNKSDEAVIKVMIRVFNNKFFKTKNTKDLTWSRWYFPVITETKSLQIIDKYLVSYLRYLSTGRFTKLNYNVKYENLKNYGYLSLVNQYYKFKEGKKEE